MATLRYRWKFDEGSGQYAYDSVSGVSAKLYNSTPGDRGVFWNSGGYDGACISGNGTAGQDTGALVSATESNLLRNFSITGWIKTSVQQNAGILSLVGEGDFADLYRSMALHFEKKTPTPIASICFEMLAADGMFVSLRNSDPTKRYDDGEWHFWCVTSSSTGPVTKLYLDACDTEVVATNYQPYQGFSDTYHWRIGGSGSFSIRPGKSFDGGVDDIRIYDGVLTPAEICAVKTDFVAPGVTNAMMFSCNT